MKTKDFQKLIRELPYRNQSFDIKSSNWEVASQQNNIERIFNNKPEITINRNDLYNSNTSIENFIIKTLMWGYPTKGRGNNIIQMLEKDVFMNLSQILIEYKDSDITVKKIKQNIKGISGLGMSTITKFTNFLNTTIEGNKAVILDLQVINSIRRNQFEEFSSLKTINYNNGINKYSDYINIVNEIANDIDAKPEQLELFLFLFGRSLSSLK